MNDYEYSETPGNDMTRATTNCLYLIDCRKEEVIEKLHEEFKELILAGLYLLLDNTANKIYIGESSNISERLKQHIKKIDIPDFKFDRILLVWDGRPVSTSHFGDEALRKSLEKECIKLFKNNSSKFQSVNTVEKPKETNFQVRSSSNRITKELNFLLYKYHLLDTLQD